MHALSQIVDLDRYPLHEPESAAYVAAVDAAREGLRADGCAVIKDLVRPEAVALQPKPSSWRSHICNSQAIGEAALAADLIMT